MEKHQISIINQKECRIAKNIYNFLPLIKQIQFLYLKRFVGTKDADGQARPRKRMPIDNVFG